MKAIILLVCFFISLSGFNAQSNKLRVYMDTKYFSAPSLGNYVEINFQFVGSTLGYQGVPGGLQADLAIYLSVEKNGVAIQNDAYRLESPLMRDSIVEDFYDLRRYVLEPGQYELKVEVNDLIAKGDPIKGTIPIQITDKQGKIHLSDIVIAEYAHPGDETSPFFKSGFSIVPKLSTYYPEQLTSLPYYTELYNTNKLEGKEFGLKQSIHNAENNLELDEYTNFYRLKTAEVVPVLKQIDIQKLRSGKYYLLLSIIDSKMNPIKDQKYFFERSNEPEFNLNEDEIVLNPNFTESIGLDSAQYFLASLIPISTQEGTRRILDLLKLKDPEKSLKFIQSFWVMTNEKDAYNSWMKYKAQVVHIEKLYGNNFQAGFESDRGRVYLQYGSPTNLIQREISASEYPYEIWVYDKINQFSNRRFIFYNTDLASQNYRLLHSDMIGEIKNQAWPQALNSRNTTKGSVDDPNGGVQQHYGGQSNDLFRNF